MSVPTTCPQFRGRLACRGVGWEHRVRSARTVPRKRPSPPSLQKFWPMSLTPGCPVSPGPLKPAGSFRTLFGWKPNLILASLSLLLCRQNCEDSRSRWALLHTGVLAEMRLQLSFFLDLLLLGCWPAPARPSPQLRGHPGTPALGPSLSAGLCECACSCGDQDKTRLTATCSHPLGTAEYPLRS